MAFALRPCQTTPSSSGCAARSLSNSFQSWFVVKGFPAPFPLSWVKNGPGRFSQVAISAFNSETIGHHGRTPVFFCRRQRPPSSMSFQPMRTRSLARCPVYRPRKKARRMAPVRHSSAKASCSGVQGKCPRPFSKRCTPCVGSRPRSSRGPVAQRHIARRASSTLFAVPGFSLPILSIRACTCEGRSWSDGRLPQASRTMRKWRLYCS